MVDSDENRSAEHQLAECRKSDSSARRICQKQFQSKDGNIKVSVDCNKFTFTFFSFYSTLTFIITPHSDLFTA